MTPHFSTDPLFRELRRLAAALAPRGVPVIIGGGYGLLLRQRRVERDGEGDQVPTLMEVPPARATQDLDVFLTVEVLADAEKAEAVREALVELGYVVIAGRESYQFAQPVDETETFPKGVKVDLLAPVPTDMRAYPTLKTEPTRRGRKIKNRDVKGLNAFATREAFTVADGTERVELGPSEGLYAEIPHPFSYLVFKLFAYRDRMNDDTKDFRYHAYDLYRVVAMLTEAEAEEVEAMRAKVETDPVVVEASGIAADLFGDADRAGAVAVQGYSRVVGSDLSVDDVSTFCGHLGALLPALGIGPDA